jgi:hypothetical protein
VTLNDRAIIAEAMSIPVQPLIAKIKEMQDGLVSHATGGSFEGANERFQTLRADLLQAPSLKGKLPEFLRNNRDLFQFWEFIKHSFPKYALRRRFLWDSFAPLIELLETEDLAPAAPTITGRLESLSADAVNEAWGKVACSPRIGPPEMGVPR